MYQRIILTAPRDLGGQFDYFNISLAELYLYYALVAYST